MLVKAPTRLSTVILVLPLLLASRVPATDASATIQSGPQAAAPATSFRIHDFMPDFWRFWAVARGRPVARQARLWQELYVRPHQAVFADLAEPCKDEFAPAWALTHYFPNLPKIVPSMHEAAADLPQKLSSAHNRFLRMFPDMRWSGDVYVMASGYCFNGRAQSVRGHEAILLGIDTRVALGQRDPVPDMTHELFHRYHSEFFDFKPSSGYPLWTTLWAEGMAEFVAEKLNPAASDADLSLVPIGMPQQVDARRQELAADFLRVFTATDEGDAKKWFNDTNSRDPVVPARAGYQLGVLVARELAKRYPIQAMAHWSRSEAEPHIEAALASIAHAHLQSKIGSGALWDPGAFDVGKRPPSSCQGPIPLFLQRPADPPTAPELELALANTMRELDAGQSHRRGPVVLEAEHRPAPALDRPVVLLDDVI